MVNDVQRDIYNDYLKAYAAFQGRPYRKRNDFSKADKGLLAALDKMERFFEQYKHIQPYLFFKATFDTTDKKYVKFEDFTKYSAVAAYSRWSRERNENNADSAEVLQSFKDGIVFIRDFVKEKGIKFSEYKRAVNPFGVPWFIIHLKEQRITVYHLHFLNVAPRDIALDYQEFVMMDFEGVFDKTKRNYENSVTMKEIGSKAADALLKNC